MIYIKMKKYIPLILIILFLFLIGCKKGSSPDSAAVIDQATQIIEEMETEIDEIELIIQEQDNKTDEVESIVEEINDTETKEENLIPAGTHVVEMQKTITSMKFFPKELEINVYDTVRWVNKLDYLEKKAKVRVQAAHNNLFKSPLLAYDESFEFTFNEKGTFIYNAVPYESYFKPGTIIVR